LLGATKPPWERGRPALARSEGAPAVLWAHSQPLRKTYAITSLYVSLLLQEELRFHCDGEVSEAFYVKHSMYSADSSSGAGKGHCSLQRRHFATFRGTVHATVHDSSVFVCFWWICWIVELVTY
jgi:hypothetical protein